MTKIVKHTIRLITLLLTVSMVAFGLMELSPIDPVQAYIGAGVAVSPEQRENIEAYWNPEGTAIERYGTWLTSVLQGDLGDSLIYRKPVIEVIGERMGNSLALMIGAWMLSGLIGLLLGSIMGKYENTTLDRGIKSVCLTISSMPTFWIGLLFLMIFSIWLKWFPIGFSVPIGVMADQVTIFQKIYHMILPAFALSFASFPNIALHTREKVIEVLQSDYILFAKARGESHDFRKHGLRHILLPAITLQFTSFGEIFGGSILAEQVFSYEGLGQAVVDAGLQGDVPLLLGITLFSAIFVFFGNLTANIIYTIVDPRMRKGTRI